MKKHIPQAVTLLILIFAISEGFAQDGWILRKSGTFRKLRSISSADGQNVVAVGDSGVVVTSSDAGVTWELQKQIVWISPFSLSGIPGPDTNLNGVAAFSGKIFCAVGPRDSVFRSTDAGHSWVGIRSRAKGDCLTLTNKFFELKEMHAIDFDTSNKLCIAVGDGGEAIFSRDSGKKWFENLPNSLEHFTGVSSWNGYSLASLTYGEAFSTADQGDTWTTAWVQKNDSLFGCSMQGLTIVGQSGSIFHTPNKGIAWDPEPSGTTANLNAVYFGNIVRGYIAGDNGTILMTKDGGYTWQQQFCPTSKNLRSVHMFDPFHGFICGDSGVILTTQNGGYYDAVTEAMPQSSYSVKNYPNPFSSRTTIEISIPHRGHLSLRIFDVLGKEITTLADGNFEGGVLNFNWDASGVSSGIYTCKLDMDGVSIVSEITVAK